MKKILLIFFIINFNNFSFGSVKENIINNLQNTDNLSFDFEQNINGKIEKGNCIIEYPKKIFCNYDNANNKTLISNGKSLVIKTNSGSSIEFTQESHIYKLKQILPAFQKLVLKNIVSDSKGLIE